MLLAAVACGFSTQAGIGSVVAWPFKKVDQLQRSVFSTKTTGSKARLAFFALVLLGRATEGDGSIQNAPVGSVLSLLSFSGCSVENRHLAGDAARREKELCVAGIVAWAGIFLTAWNNSRDSNDVKKTAEESKEALGVEETDAGSTD